MPSKRSTPSAEDAEEALHDLRPLLGVELLGQLHRALHVGEEHGHLLALAFEGGLRLAGSSRRGCLGVSVAGDLGGRRTGRQRAPQPPQNFSPAWFGAPQAGQAAATRRRTRQNRPSARFSWLQDGHCIGSQQLVLRIAMIASCSVPCGVSQRDDVAELCLQERHRDWRNPRDARAGRIDSSTPATLTLPWAPDSSAAVRSEPTVTVRARAPEPPCP